MKNFTVKDFISINNPCFNCQGSIYFSIISSGRENQALRFIEIKPVVSLEGSLFDLQITYNEKLQLWVEHYSNKITISNPELFKKYISQRRLFLQSNCEKCHTTIQSDFLEFTDTVIKPTRIQYEYLSISDSNCSYFITSNVPENYSHLIITPPTPNNVVNMRTPPLLLSSLRTKENFLKKIKTYLIFS